MTVYQKAFIAAWLAVAAQHMAGCRTLDVLAELGEVSRPTHRIVGPDGKMIGEVYEVPR